jgi:hypothetical protein
LDDAQPLKDPDEPGLVWYPQEGPQEALFHCPIADILFGGARGGGKTDGVLGRLGFRAHQYGRLFNGCIFRPTMPSQDDIFERACQIYREVGAVPYEYNHTIKFREGGRLRFRPLERVQDADKYQGQNLSDVWVEEVGLYPSPDPIDRLWGAMRSGQGKVSASLIVTGNPGGAGQHWIKERYIDPWPAGNRPLRVYLPNGKFHERIFIPSRIEDNKILLANDPEYINRLYLVGHPSLVRAWLKGDWSAVEGAFFPEWRQDRHVMRPFPIPKDWSRYCSMDWGSAKPFSIGWHAIANDDLKVDGRWIRRGCAVRYREWYGRGYKYNEGLKLTVEEVAAGIKAREGWRDGKPNPEEPIRFRVADPSIFQVDGGPSHGERFSRQHVHFSPGDNRRLPEVGHMIGWDLVRARLKGEDGDPMLVVFDTCPDLIRTLPLAQHDKAKPEDLDTKSEDHALDEERYFCAARVFTPRSFKETVVRRPVDGYRPKRSVSWKEL